jgi:hypothetical protein
LPIGPGFGSPPTSAPEGRRTFAELYRVQGRHADAEPLYKRALAIEEKAHGPSHPDVATLLDNLADLYERERRSADAEPLLPSLSLGDRSADMPWASID